MNIDVNDLRAAITALSFIGFLAIVFWAYAGRRKAAFERVAQSILDDEGEGAQR
jgi:cbb3-type cytochrome oxidase subunit 3